jgi:hypothetical protein
MEMEGGECGTFHIAGRPPVKFVIFDEELEVLGKASSSDDLAVLMARLVKCGHPLNTQKVFGALPDIVVDCEVTVTITVPEQGALFNEVTGKA